MSIKEIRERVEESKRLNGVFGPQAQDDLEELLALLDRLTDLLRTVQDFGTGCAYSPRHQDEFQDARREAFELLAELEATE